MFYVYILKSSADDSFYIGQTQDVVDRLKRHNLGLEKFTRKKMPWTLIWATTVATRSEAIQLERKIKNFKSRKRIQAFIDKYANSKT